MMKLSIIIPVYNSSKILEKLITEINSNLSVRFKNDYEIILVNDFSKDNSWDIIKKISKEFNFIKGIDLNYSKATLHLAWCSMAIGIGEITQKNYLQVYFRHLFLCRISAITKCPVTLVDV